MLRSRRCVDTTELLYETNGAMHPSKTDARKHRAASEVSRVEKDSDGPPPSLVEERGREEDGEVKKAHGD